MKNEIEPLLTGVIDAKHIAYIGAQLSDDPKALKIFEEFTNPENLKNPEEVSGVIADIRHRVYELGLEGGADEIEERAIARNGTLDEDEHEKYQQKLIWKSAIAFLALSKLSSEQRNTALGMIRGRSLKPMLEATDAKYFEPNGNLHRAVTAKTPLNDLLWLIALHTTQAENEPTEKAWYERARRTAGEHLIRTLMTNNEELIALASRLFDLRYYEAIFQQMPEALANGKIGGKALGYLIGNAGIEYETQQFDQAFAEQHRMSPEQLRKKLALDTCMCENFSEFIGSGIFQKTIQHNRRLAKAPLLKEFYMNGEQLPKRLHEEIQTAWEKAEFPPHIERQLKMLFARRHGRPIIVRSSSELEDRHGASFAGQYKSFELANSGDFGEDFQKFKKAVLEIYASVYSPDVMAYRRKKNLLRDDEEMGILIQNLNGAQHEDYFYPDISAVVMSHATQAVIPPNNNSGKNSAENGAMRIAAGLGRRIVDESGGHYAMFKNPRATLEAQENRPQCEIYVLNMQSGKVEKRLKSTIESSKGWYRISANDQQAFSFKNLLQDSPVPLQLEYIVQKLKYLWGCDVDCEFTLQYDDNKEIWTIQLVQCRPQNIPENLIPSRIPETVLDNHIVMRTEKSVNGTSLENISHVVYIDPKIFSECTQTERAWIQKYISVINKELERERYLIIAPRSWGSKDPESGLPVKFIDFSNAAGVIEIWERGTSAPSFGAHFFQVFGDCNMAFGACSNNDFLQGNDRGNFFHVASHADGCPSIQNQHGINEKIAKKLSRYIKVIDVNAAYQTLYGSNNSEMRLHLAQDNTSTLDDKCPATLYFAKKGKDKPIPVRELAK